MASLIGDLLPLLLLCGGFLVVLVGLIVFAVWRGWEID